ncbi:unnamed protein product [Allacma fusca]|uniref:CRAL-TRIO domain-containing protein n=1 Tax=Allacma fusca TaxID=39272 RepID=A0A8J2KNQ1_9HEXA|nr:unnamed protein product [Allacma fusca]
MWSNEQHIISKRLSSFKRHLSGANIGPHAVPCFLKIHAEYTPSVRPDIDFQVYSVNLKSKIIDFLKLEVFRNILLTRDQLDKSSRGKPLSLLSSSSQVISEFCCVFLSAATDTDSSENSTEVSSNLATISPTKIAPELAAIEKEIITQLLNVSQNVVDEKLDSEAELLAWEAPLDIRTNYPYYLSGFDAENRPIWIAELGKWNLRKVVEAGGETFKNFDKYVQQSRIRITKSRALKSTPGHIVTEAVFLLDLDELKLSQIASVPTVSYILNLARQYRKLLTEHTGVAVVVNANFVAESLVNIVRPVFGAILERTEIYGTNRARWLPHVLRHFPKDQIPECGSKLIYLTGFNPKR